MRLLQYIQTNYNLSRRAITAAIKSGSVFVDDQKVESFALEIVPWQRVSGRIGELKLNDIVRTIEQSSQIVLFHKPAWYVCSRADKHNSTIYELLSREYRDRYYIGRLDKDSRGLLLLTNTSKLVHHFEHPKFGITKQYLALVRFADQWFARRLVQDETSQDFFTIVKWLVTKGLLVDDDGYLAKKWAPWAATLRAQDLQNKTWDTILYRRFGIANDLSDKYFLFDITLQEWKKRHIRRLFHSIWGEVKDLIRLRVGEHTLWKLQEGELSSPVSM